MSSAEVSDLKQQLADLKMQLAVEVSAHRAVGEELAQHQLAVRALTDAREADQTALASLQRQLAANLALHESTVASLTNQLQV